MEGWLSLPRYHQSFETKGLWAITYCKREKVMAGLTHLFEMNHPQVYVLFVFCTAMQRPSMMKSISFEFLLWSRGSFLLHIFSLKHFIWLFHFIISAIWSWFEVPLRRFSNVWWTFFYFYILRVCHSCSYFFYWNPLHCACRAIQPEPLKHIYLWNVSGSNYNQLTLVCLSALTVPLQQQVCLCNLSERSGCKMYIFYYLCKD